MNGAKILVVDDEKGIRRFLENILQENGYAVFLAENAQKAIYQVKNKHPDLILLDLNLPDMFGAELLKKIRALYNTPVIAVTVLNSDEEKENILDLGADDYITKPFSSKELLARVRVALRHGVNLKAEPVYKNGPLCVDFNLRQVSIGGENVKLTANEFDVLKVLIAGEGKIITQTHILREVWGPAAVEQGHYVRIYVANLRRKLEVFPSMEGFIKTEQGVGYRIETAINK
jgi:Response regulators consisting of a CheY-like receiver domain and a winged-helix DNA-binding domain